LHLWSIISADLKYPLCFLSALVMRLVSVLFAVYMILWLGSFVHTGQIQDQTQVLMVYRQIVIISMILTGVLLPVIGYMADRTPSRIIVPAAFFTRFVACFFFV